MREEPVHAVMRVATHGVSLRLENGLRVRHLFTGTSAAARFGSDTPSSLDVRHRTPNEIVAEELDRVLSDRGPGRDCLVLVPDSWGAHRRRLIGGHFAEDATIRNETPALLDSAEGVSDDARPALLVRVGSETTSAAVHARVGGDWRPQQRAETDWGGDDLDDLLVAFVRARLQDDNTPAEALRRQCTLARERLSTDIHADVNGVRVHRADLEELARDGLVRSLRGTLTSVLQELPETPERIWLAGGVAAMPLVAQLVSEIADRPVRLLDWTNVTAPAREPSAEPEPESAAAAPETARVPLPARALKGATVVDLATTRPRPEREKSNRRRLRIAGLVAAAVALTAFAGAAFLQPGGAGAVLSFMIGSKPGQPHPGGVLPAQAATRTPARSGEPASQPSASASPGAPGFLPGQAPSAGGTPGVPPVDPSATPAPGAAVPGPAAAAPGAPAAVSPATAGQAPAAAPPPPPAPAAPAPTRPAPAPATTQDPPPPPVTQAPVDPAPTDPAPTDPAPTDPTGASPETNAALAATEGPGDAAP